MVIGLGGFSLSMPQTVQAQINTPQQVVDTCTAGNGATCTCDGCSADADSCSCPND